jgi:small subunit ribosomal protein S21
MQKPRDLSTLGLCKRQSLVIHTAFLSQGGEFSRGILRSEFAQLFWRSGFVHVTVRDNNIDQALRALKKKMQREGVFREMKLRRNFEKPSEKRAREKAEAVRRYRKLMRKRMEREGF